MDKYVSELIAQIHDLLHRIEGYEDAREATKPKLRFVDDEPRGKVLLFPTVERQATVLSDNGGEKEKTPDFEKPGEQEEGFVEFTQKEISQMPKNIKRLIIIDKKRCRLRTRRSGKNSITYQIRFRREGYEINANGKTIELAKVNFIEKAKTAKPIASKAESTLDIPTTFTAFALYHFENFKKERVSKKHHENTLRLFNRYLSPHLKETPFVKITPSDCKIILDEVKAQGKGKTADDLYSQLNGIFKNAIAHGLMQRNPLALILHTQHARENGKAITREDEQTLLSAVKNTDFELAVALALYCGLRPNELETVQINGEFIKAVNSKRKGGKIEYKYIPIINRLRPFLPGDNIFRIPNLDMLRREIKKVLPGHKLYDLRTTFYTRCDELGVSAPARDEFVGHSSGVLTNTYRDLSKAYLLSEGKKLNAW